MDMGYELLRKKHVLMVLFKYNKRRCTSIISNVNSNESNKLNISNWDNVIYMSKFPHSNVQNFS